LQYLRTVGEDDDPEVMSLGRQRTRTDIRERLRRVVVMAPSIAQCSVAAGLAWVTARELLGHPQPFFAPIAAVICVGITLGQRLRRLAELIVGVGLGIGVGDLIISVIGSGAWQLSLVVALAMTAAVLLDRGQLIALQAGSSAVLVATLLPPGGTGGMVRMLDALTGGALGIATVALLPASPATIAHRHASAVLEALASALERIGEAVRRSDQARAAKALEDARGTQLVIEELRTALVAGKEITSLSPLHWRWRRQLLRYKTASAPVDHAIRNTRVLARRTMVALRENEPTPESFPEAVRALAHATLLLRDELAAGRDPAMARAAVLVLTDHPSVTPRGRAGFSADVMTAQLRSIIVDLLLAAGADRDSALSALPQPIRPRGRGVAEAAGSVGRRGDESPDGHSGGPTGHGGVTG
jgi:uncharacterized membrane protein YgaE (UPF0421/DUF939 family)